MGNESFETNSAGAAFHDYFADHDADEAPSNQDTLHSQRPSIRDIVEARISRRQALSGMIATAAAASIPTSFFARGARALEEAAGTTAARAQSTLGFKEIENVITTSHRISEGYDAQVLIRWGDDVVGGARPFDPNALTHEDQSRQFGYNCDFIAFMPLPAGSTNSDHGLLCVNHEYTNPELMFTGVTSQRELTREQVEIEMAAHGHGVVEIKKSGRGWETVKNSRYNRRITADQTTFAISGPAAGHRRMRTSADPSGTRVIGTINNCAGGFTPWGTVLVAEENFNLYFQGDPAKTPENRNLSRYGFGDPRYAWGKYDTRFDIEKEPNEANRFGWVCEFDPYDPSSTPVKRTALGRFKHEGATTVINHDGRIVVYSGDDQAFDYVYKFVTHGRYDPNSRERNRNLLDSGTLFVARFHEDGSMQWLPLVWGTGPLTPVNDFHSQADVLIETRRAADLLGATPMDRPEDVEPNPATGRVYVMLTNNTGRERVDAANPRPANQYGHIIEIEPPKVGNDVEHASLSGSWNVFLRAGNPNERTHGAVYHPDVSRDGWLACPDNVAFDNKGRMWIATDQGSAQARHGIPDGIRATDTEGDARALTKLFFACPMGAEMCGPCFTPDNTTMFVAVQHPGEGNRANPSTFENPATRWPDFQDGMPPRPSVVAITKKDGGAIGG